MTAADHVTLHIPYGHLRLARDPNGAGKSTTIKMLTTLLQPSEGTATVAGFDIVKAPSQVRRSIGYVPQALSADGGLTGWENLNLSAKLYGIPRAERKLRIEDACTSWASPIRPQAGENLFGRHDPPPGDRASDAARPTILFLDEPTVGLDPVARRTVWERLLELRQKYA